MGTRRESETTAGHGDDWTMEVVVCRRPMYDPYIMKRTQIYLEDGQAGRLSRLAHARGTTF